jgi:arachidonate 15-lipoxygenase
MIPSLPQDDPAREARLRRLARNRDVYRYSYDHLPGVALADTVPERDGPSAEWVALVSVTLMKILINHAKLTGRDDFSCHHDEVHVSILDAVRASRGNVVAAALDHIAAHALGGDIEETQEAGIDEYTEAFHEIRLPRCALVWDEDEQFAWYRTRGPNPMEIRRVDALDDRFPVTEELYRAVMGEGDSLAAAGAEGRLFLTDYAALDGLRCGRTASGRQKHLSAPLAVFATDRRSSALRPVAIQCGQRPGAETPIFTPRDGGFAWRLAKAHVQAADANVHQAVRQLAHTHLVLDPIVMAARRQLSHYHPLSVLLNPHFEGTLEINNGAWKKLMADGGGVELVLAGEIGAVRALAARAALDWVFDERMFPREIESRGLGDASVLPHYAYRKDGRLLWEAIHAWADSYVRLYYTSPADVSGAWRVT